MEIKKIREYTAHKDSVYTLKFAGEDHFISAGGDGSVVKWNVYNDGAGLLLARLPSAVYSLVLNGNILYAGCRHGQLFMLNLESKEQVGKADLSGDIYDMILGADKLLILTSQGDFYRVDPSNVNSYEVVKFSEESGRTLAISPSGKEIISGWSDNLIRILQLPDYDHLQTLEGHNNSVFTVCYLDEKTFLSGSRDAQIKVWSKNNDEYEQLLNIPAHWFTVNQIVRHPSLPYFVSGSRDKSIKIWHSESYALIRTIERPYFEAHTHSVNKVLWLTDKLLLSAGDDKKIILWEVTF